MKKDVNYVTIAFSKEQFAELQKEAEKIGCKDQVSYIMKCVQLACLMADRGLGKPDVSVFVVEKQKYKTIKTDDKKDKRAALLFEDKADIVDIAKEVDEVLELEKQAMLSNAMNLPYTPAKA